MGFIERNKAALNDVVSASFVGRYFHLDGSGHVRRPGTLIQHTVLTSKAKRDQECEVYH
jgi:hypothetical protein